MTLRTAVLSIALLAGCAANAGDAADDGTDWPAEETMMHTDCTMKLDFTDDDEVARWRTVLDGVMGGRSTGTRYAEDGDGGGHMVFRGEINTNGGGFSSIRREMEPGDMAGANSITLRIRPDARAYRLTFRTSERFRGRSVSYQADIPSGVPGEWAEVSVPLSGLATSVFGRDVPAAPFEPSDVREMGIIIADGVDGPFRLEAEFLQCG